MPIAQTLIMELEQETKTTRNVLARIPNDKLAWKPHTKSMSLGGLAGHIATIPGGMAKIASLESFDVSGFKPPAEPESAAAAVATLEEGVAQAKAILGAMDDAALMQDWSLIRDGRPMMTIPRIGVVRTMLLNHLYHHRGQLSVYLRLLDVPVPAIYGASADESPAG
jgi:uncharacterized damage-inducible protein DinB